MTRPIHPGSANTYAVTFIPKGSDEPDTLQLAAEEWPADHDTAVTAIRARFERDYGEVITIHYRSNQPNERFPSGRQLYGARRYE